MLEYTKAQDPKFTDDNSIICALYSPINLEFYIAGGRSLKVWSATTGAIRKSLGEITKSDITAMCLNENHRKLFVADHEGSIRLYDLLTGRLLKELSPHPKEVSGLCYAYAEM